jgi:hypothetical protein
VEGRIIAVLVARPQGDGWAEVIAGVESAFEDARGQMSKSSSGTDGRGEFTKVNVGYSYGGGQEVWPCLSQHSVVQTLHLETGERQHSQQI